jgi:hypothetical protein
LQGEPLEEHDPLKVNAILKNITIQPDFILHPPHSLPLPQKKDTEKEYSFLDELLATPTDHHHQHPAPIPSPSSSIPSSITAPPTPQPTVGGMKSGAKEKVKEEDVTKASVEDLEDWLDSVI